MRKQDLEPQFYYKQKSFTIVIYQIWRYYMKDKNIITVIEELGEIISKYKDDIKFKDYQIQSLKEKIEQIESYLDVIQNKNVG